MAFAGDIGSAAALGALAARCLPCRVENACALGLRAYPTLWWLLKGLKSGCSRNQQAVYHECRRSMLAVDVAAVCVRQLESTHPCRRPHAEWMDAEHSVPAAYLCAPQMFPGPQGLLGRAANCPSKTHLAPLQRHNRLPHDRCPGLLSHRHRQLHAETAARRLPWLQAMSGH